MSASRLAASQPIPPSDRASLNPMCLTQALDLTPYGGPLVLRVLSEVSPPGRVGTLGT